MTERMSATAESRSQSETSSVGEMGPNLAPLNLVHEQLFQSLRTHLLLTLQTSSPAQRDTILYCLHELIRSEASNVNIPCPTAPCFPHAAGKSIPDDDPGDVTTAGDAEEMKHWKKTIEDSLSAGQYKVSPSSAHSFANLIYGEMLGDSGRQRVLKLINANVAINVKSTTRKTPDAEGGEGGPVPDKDGPYLGSTRNGTVNQDDAMNIQDIDDFEDDGDLDNAERLLAERCTQVVGMCAAGETRDFFEAMANFLLACQDDDQDLGELRCLLRAAEVGSQFEQLLHQYLRGQVLLMPEGSIDDATSVWTKQGLLVQLQRLLDIPPHDINILWTMLGFCTTLAEFVKYMTRGALCLLSLKDIDRLPQAPAAGWILAKIVEVTPGLQNVLFILETHFIPTLVGEAPSFTKAQLDDTGEPLLQMLQETLKQNGIPDQQHGGDND